MHRLPEIDTTQLTLVEVVFGLIAITLALIQARRKRVSEAFPPALRMLSRRYFACGIVAALLPLIIRLALLPSIPVPSPAIQEEFSNLLEADTFSHGRLANPPHPMSVFFDNVQIIQYPKYVSVRLPGTPAFLWLGEALFQQPWFGVCFAVAAMCAAFYWMLLGWTRPLWAFVIAILFALRFGIFTYWMNSYWPGSPAALGGALVLGAAPRIYDRAKVLPAILYALGAVILEFNRPIEGALLIVPTTIAVLAHWFSRRESIRVRDFALRCILPAAIIGAAALAFLMRYNAAATGCARIPAYAIWRAGQAITPTFWWQHLRNVDLVYYSRQTWQFFHEFETGLYNQLNESLHARLRTLFWRTVMFPRIDLGFLLLIPLLFPPLAANSRTAKRWLAFYAAALAVGAMGFVLYSHVDAVPEFAFLVLYAAALIVRFGPEAGKFRLPLALILISLLWRLVVVFDMASYYAEYLAPAMILAAGGFRRLHAWRRESRAGAVLARNICLACCGMAVVHAAIPVFGYHVAGEEPFYMSSYENRLPDRARVQRFLEAQPGPQLAIVRYGPKHDVLHEWVWNGSAIDQQKVVWAREQRPEWTMQLLRYYLARKAWLIEPDATPVRVAPYPLAPAAGSSDSPPQAIYVNTPSCR